MGQSHCRFKFKRSRNHWLCCLAMVPSLSILQVPKLGEGKRKLRQTREGTGHQPKGLGANPRGCSLPYRNTKCHLHEPLFLHKNHD